MTYAGASKGRHAYQGTVSHGTVHASQDFATEAEAREFVRKTIREWWTNPPRPVDPATGEPIPFEPAIPPDRPPFSYGAGHGVSHWSAAKWRMVGKIQADYRRATAEVWARAVAECSPALDRWVALEKQMPAKTCPIPGHPGRTTSARDYVNKARKEAAKELRAMGDRWFSPRWPDYLVAALKEAAARRDTKIAQVTN